MTYFQRITVVGVGSCDAVDDPSVVDQIPVLAVFGLLLARAVKMLLVVLEGLLNVLFFLEQICEVEGGVGLGVEDAQLLGERVVLLEVCLRVVDLVDLHECLGDLGVGLHLLRLGLLPLTQKMRKTGLLWSEEISRYCFWYWMDFS